jgi:signal peptidase II
VIDQLTKWWAVERLSDGRVELIGSLQLNLVRNYGSAFSIGGGSGWGGLVSILGLGIIVGLLWFARSMTTRLGLVALGLVIGGAVGNLIDRAARSDRGFMGGGVVDFVDLQWWPVFNVADAAVVIGVVTLLVVTLVGDQSLPSGDRGSRRA